MMVGAIGAVGGVGMMGGIQGVGSIGAQPSISQAPSIQTSVGITDKVSLGENLSKPLFGSSSGIQMYQGINNLAQPGYVSGFVDGMIMSNAVDPLNKMDEIIAMLLLAMLLQQQK